VIVGVARRLGLRVARRSLSRWFRRDRLSRGADGVRRRIRVGSARVALRPGIRVISLGLGVSLPDPIAEAGAVVEA
jgi:hypothetical protein